MGMYASGQSKSGRPQMTYSLCKMTVERLRRFEFYPCPPQIQNGNWVIQMLVPYFGIFLDTDDLSQRQYSKYMRLREECWAAYKNYFEADRYLYRCLLEGYDPDHE